MSMKCELFFSILDARGDSYTTKAWMWKGPGQLIMSQCTLYEELYLFCSNQEQERYNDLPNCVTAVLVALINYSPQ